MGVERARTLISPYNPVVTMVATWSSTSPSAIANERANERSRLRSRGLRACDGAEVTGSVTRVGCV
jgi:hypothetical protein